MSLENLKLGAFCASSEFVKRSFYSAEVLMTSTECSSQGRDGILNNKEPTRVSSVLANQMCLARFYCDLVSLSKKRITSSHCNYFLLFNHMGEKTSSKIFSFIQFIPKIFFSSFFLLSKGKTCEVFFGLLSCNFMYHLSIFFVFHK